MVFLMIEIIHNVSYCCSTLFLPLLQGLLYIESYTFCIHYDYHICYDCFVEIYLLEKFLESFTFILQSPA